MAGLTVAAFILGVSIYEVITHPKGTSRGRSSRQRPRPKPATPAPSPPDLSAVRVGQRYIFDHDGYQEVWTIDSVAGGEVRYRCRREAPPNRAVIETLERWKAPPWELVFRDLKAPRAFGLKPGLSGDFLYWNSDARWDVYLVKGYRVVFPGLLKERPTRRGGKRVLVRVEPP